MTFRLRSYQQEAIDAVQSDWANGNSDVVLAMGTGLGKTEIGIHLLKQTMKPSERVLWLAHTSELLFQPLERIKKYWPSISVGVVKAQQNEVTARFILGSVQTVCRSNRLQPVLDAGRIDYLVTDECLPYNTQVLLASGVTCAIGDMETLDSPEVVCYDRGVLSTRPVSKTWKLQPKAPLVRIVHEQGELVCTGNHRVLTQDGWMPAGLLEENYDHLLTLQQKIQESGSIDQAPVTRTGPLQPQGRVSSLWQSSGSSCSSFTHEISSVPMPTLRRDLRTEAQARSTHQARAHRLSLQAVRPCGEHASATDQSQMDGTSQPGPRTTVDQGHARISSETLGMQDGREKSDVRQARCGQDGSGMVDSRATRGTETERPGRMARRRVRSCADDRTRSQAQQFRAGLLGDASRGGTRLPDLHRRLQSMDQDGQSLQEPRFCGGGREDGHRGVWQVLPRAVGDSTTPTVLQECRMAGVDSVGGRNTEGARESDSLDYGVPRPSLVLSVKTLPEQEQWVYDLTVDEVHNFIADGVIVSNCHHGAASTYLKIYEALRAQNPNLKHVGLTATPKRSDGKNLRDVFDKLSFQMGILKGVRQGWLVPPKGMQIETGIDTSGVKVSHGDFVVGDLADVLDANEWHVKVFEAFAEHAADKQCIAYTPTVTTSKRLVEEFTERGIKARHVDGTTPKDERKESVRLFREQKIQVLSSCAVFLEGFDAPSANCILMARPTQSHVLLTQVIGRGLRIFPGKTECLVLMFATTDARLLTIFDLGESKELKKAKEAAEELAIEGVSGAIPLFDEDKIDGVGLYAKVVNLFSSSTAAWYRDGAEFSLGLGEHEGYQRTLFITPPNGGNEWHLWGLGRSVVHEGGAWSRNGKAKYGPWVARELSCGPDVDALMAEAAGIVERRGMPILSEKKKKWRAQPATSGQKRFARRWSPTDVVERLTKGAAAKLITHGVAKDALGRL